MESQTGMVKMPYSKTVLEKVVSYLYSGKRTCEGLTLAASIRAKWGRARSPVREVGDASVSGTPTIGDAGTRVTRRPV